MAPAPRRRRRVLRTGGAMQSAEGLRLTALVSARHAATWCPHPLEPHREGSPRACRTPGPAAAHETLRPHALTTVLVAGAVTASVARRQTTAARAAIPGAGPERPRYAVCGWLRSSPPTSATRRRGEHCALLCRARARAYAAVLHYNRADYACGVWSFRSFAPRGGGSGLPEVMALEERPPPTPRSVSIGV